MSTALAEHPVLVHFSNWARDRGHYTVEDHMKGYLMYVENTGDEPNLTREDRKSEPEEENRGSFL